MSGPVIVLCAALGAALGPILHAAVAEVPHRRPVRAAVVWTPGAWGPPTIVLGVVNGGLWAAATWRFSSWWVVVPFAILYSVLLVVSAIDVEHLRIPDRITFPALTVALPLVVAASIVLDAPRAIVGAVAGAAIYFLLLLIPHLVYPKGMGFGDVKLALLMGLYLGWLVPACPDLTSHALGVLSFVLIGLLIGSILGVVGGVATAIARGRRGAFPFGPALAASAVIGSLFSESLIGDTLCF